MGKTKVIFLCTGNFARSQMAEVFFRKYAKNYFEVFSACFKPRGINPLTNKVMEEIGYDLSNHISKKLKQYLGKMHFGVVITVCAKAEEKCLTFPGVGTRLFWPFEDPADFEGSEDEKLDNFREVRDLVNEKIQEWLKERGILN